MNKLDDLALGSPEYITNMQRIDHVLLNEGPLWIAERVPDMRQVIVRAANYEICPVADYDGALVYMRKEQF